jgi:hypothetical protein
VNVSGLSIPIGVGAIGFSPIAFEFLPQLWILLRFVGLFGEIVLSLGITALVVKPKQYMRFRVKHSNMRKSIALLFAASSLFLPGCCTAPQTAHWEYKTETLYAGGGLNPNALNKEGKNGWEFVSATAIPNDPNRGVIVVFKRQAQP